MANTPYHKFRVDDELWNTVAVKAAGDGRNVSEVIRDGLDRYAAGVTDQKPDAVTYVVRSRTSDRGQWTAGAPMLEVHAREVYRDMRKHMPATQCQLVRREEYVIDQ